MTGKRKYELKARAESQAQTRLRITEAAMELHGSLGPARTTISAVAERAGVQRPTVYRHFPDEEALFMACSAHWIQLNAPPDIEAWAAERDPRLRLERALDDLYGYYERTEQMLVNLFRDRDQVPVLEGLLAAFDGFMAAAVEVLLRGRRSRGRRVRAAIGHAIEFETWRSLTRRQGLSQGDAVRLAVALVEAA